MPKDTNELEKLKQAAGKKEAKQDAPVAKPRKKGPKLTEKIAVEPVRFSATTGRIYAHDGRVDRHGLVETAPLIVDFGEGHGDEAQLTGGLSREFYPDRDECEREEGAGNIGSYCQCKHCLETVREYIAKDRYGVCAQWHVREADTNPPKKPYAAFDTAHVDDLEGAVRIGALVDLRNAIRWEQANQNRPAIIAKLDELAQAPAEPEDGDILAAEVVV